MITGVIETLAIFRLYHIRHFLKKVVARLTEYDGVIKHCSEGLRAYVLHWAPHLLGPALPTVLGNDIDTDVKPTEDVVFHRFKYFFHLMIACEHCNDQNICLFYN